MTGVEAAKYVALTKKGTLYEVVLLDDERSPVGHGYRGPTRKRAEQDLKYWTRIKGLEPVELD
jgi:hypothetical protein